MSRRLASRSFSALAAMSLAVCAGACVAQRTGWGAPMVATTYYDVFPPRIEYLYGIVIGDYSVLFIEVILITCWLPALWLLIFVLMRLVAARSASISPSAA